MKKAQEDLFMKFIEKAELPDKGMKVFENEELGTFGFRATDVHPTTWREIAKAVGMKMIVRRNDKRSKYYASWDESSPLPASQRTPATKIKVYIGLNKEERAHYV